MAYSFYIGEVLRLEALSRIEQEPRRRREARIALAQIEVSDMYTLCPICNQMTVTTDTRIEAGQELHCTNERCQAS